MSYNDYMYAVDRSDEYLAHYGIKGMKWGVRKAIESGNSRKLDRQYRKAQKKLTKLKARAANGSKYAKRAAALGAGAALAGGAAALGTEGLARGITGSVALGKKVRSGLHSTLGGLSDKITSTGKFDRVGAAVDNLGQTVGKLGTGSGITQKAADAAGAVSKWGSTSQSTGRLGKRFADEISKRQMKAQGLSATKNRDAVNKLFNDNRARYGSISNNTIARVGAGALGAGLAGAAAYNAYRAATTKKAAAKAQQFETEMNKAFAGTKYGAKKRRRR